MLHDHLPGVFVATAILCFSPGCTHTLNDWFVPERLDQVESLEEMERQNREYDERRKLDPSLPPRTHGGVI